MRLSTRQEQALRKKRHWQEAHGSQQAGDGGQQLLWVATQGVGGGGRGRATFFIGDCFCRETLGLPETATAAPPVLTSAWQLLEVRRHRADIRSPLGSCPQSTPSGCPPAPLVMCP